MDMAAMLSKVERQAIAAKLRAAQIELLLIEEEGKELNARSLRSVIERLERIITRLAEPEPK
jgi:hypothetical protein